MTPPNSPADSSIGALLRDAQALVATATTEALREAGSSPRELRLLERIASANATDGHRAHHMRRRLDIKVAQPGTIAATFASRGWITFTDQIWRLTPAGDAERARLTAIATAAVGNTTENSELAEALTTLIDSLGGSVAARAARRAQRRRMRERMGMRTHGNGSMRTGCGHTGHGGRGYAHGPHAHSHAEHDNHADHAGHAGHAGHAEHAGHGGHGEHGHTCEGKPHGVHPRGRGFGRRHERPHDFESASTDTER